MDEKALVEYFKAARDDFPILRQKINNHNLIYVDNGASTQKPYQVIDTFSEVYTKYYSNVHRGVHSLSEMATEKYEEVREKVADFIGAEKDEIIFTSGTTHGLNLIAFGLADQLKRDDEIVLSQMEHHANLVPWQEVAKKKGVKLKFIPLKEDYTLDIAEAEKIISKKTKIISLPHISNVLGTINPVKEIARMAHEKNAIFVLDGAQSVPHTSIDVNELGCDLLSFSSHKMCGPSGVGVVYGKRGILEKMQPIMFGGDMIYEVEFSKSSYNAVPYKFEAGTPNIEGVIAFGRAIDYLCNIGMDKVEDYEKILTRYFLEKSKDIEDFEIFGPKEVDKRAAVFSFNIKGIHPHDMSAIMDMYGVAVRGGHHCAMPLVTDVLNQCATSRISLYFYNTKDEIDFIIDILKKSKEIYRKGDFLL